MFLKHLTKTIQCKIRMFITKSGPTCLDPIKLFDQWFTESRNFCDPRDMILTAILKDGSFILQPLQCQSYSNAGFKYYLLERPEFRKNKYAALTFIWPAKRMVRIEGITNGLPKHEIQQFFFNKIPYDEQITMFCFCNLKSIKNKEDLIEQIDETKRKYEKGKVPMPPYFSGHLLEPKNIEFYEHTGDTYQKRLKFLKKEEKPEEKNQLLFEGENGWNYQILSP
nr:uncharacterized protein LOC111419908 [Onthophagus taurus]